MTSQGRGAPDRSGVTRSRRQSPTPPGGVEKSSGGVEQSGAETSIPPPRITGENFPTWSRHFWWTRRSDSLCWSRTTPRAIGNPQFCSDGPRNSAWGAPPPYLGRGSGPRHPPGQWPAGGAVSRGSLQGRVGMERRGSRHHHRVEGRRTRVLHLRTVLDRAAVDDLRAPQRCVAFGLQHTA